MTQLISRCQVRRKFLGFLWSVRCNGLIWPASRGRRACAACGHVTVLPARPAFVRVPQCESSNRLTTDWLRKIHGAGRYPSEVPKPNPFVPQL